MGVVVVACSYTYALANLPQEKEMSSMKGPGKIECGGREVLQKSQLSSLLEQFVNKHIHRWRSGGRVYSIYLLRRNRRYVSRGRANMCVWHRCRDGQQVAEGPQKQIFGPWTALILQYNSLAHTRLYIYIHSHII